MSERVQLLQGDCLDLMKQIPDGSVDLVVTSPPYDNLRGYNGIGDEWSFDKFIRIAREIEKKIKIGGVIVWIVSDATIEGSETCTSFRQALWFRKMGLNLHDTMIWLKPTFTDTGSLRYRYGSVFEYMFIFTKGKLKTFNPIKDRPNKTAGKFHCATNIRTRDGMRKMKHGHTAGEFGQRFNVWQINPCRTPSERFGHPAPFPLTLARDHIISWSAVGDVVLDPFMGSGTVGVACLNTNRRFIGIEKEEKYFAIAKDRIEKAISTPKQGELL